MSGVGDQDGPCGGQRGGRRRGGRGGGRWGLGGRLLRLHVVAGAALVPAVAPVALPERVVLRVEALVSEGAEGAVLALVFTP